MGDAPKYLSHISLVLSRVMNDIGVNEECVSNRREINLLRENIMTLCDKICEMDMTSYIFGSQTEGTTTDGLKSDMDIVMVPNDYEVIQELEECEEDKTVLVMIQDETTFPGYCKLQLLREDVGKPLIEIDDIDHGKRDSYGNVILKDISSVYPEELNIHGPAVMGKIGGMEYDHVGAHKCQKWPKQYKHWTDSKIREWPTSEMIQYIKTSGCFFVSVPHRYDKRRETWRISTSLAERCLMFSLNITQIRCYILLKMIVKTFIDPYSPDIISSYICKTLLFHCIENTSKKLWNEQNLLTCVHVVLLSMLAVIRSKNCPNYFNESANLILGKVNDLNVKELQSKLRDVLKSKGRFLLHIVFDDINSRICTYLVDSSCVIHQEDEACIGLQQYGRTLHGLLYSVCSGVTDIRLEYGNSNATLGDLLLRIRESTQKGKPQVEATHMMIPFICSFMAAVEGSKCLLQGTKLNQTALDLFDLSLRSDVTSSRLKFASYLYCTGQLERTLSVLEDVEQRVTDDIMMMCGCHCSAVPKYLPTFGGPKVNLQYPLTASLAMCVMFSKNESLCCPKELQFEFSRSTTEERSNLEEDDGWMDLVVIDSLPFMYFLQFMTYKHLGQREKQTIALDKLFDCVVDNECLSHMETSLNILGKCMEYESRVDTALKCYKASVRKRPKNNAVRWYIIMLAWLISQEGQ